ncbi:hypothetical protein [Actinoplanes sp. HUAS TT8]|uniref:hypothetical protein n=1 Tax=Actinoplanes sp. HUAS TT8 TaxID=3447453 RepID=UPI003F527A44
MRKRVTDACARALACCGFTRRRHGILLQPEFGWLDLGLSDDDDTSVVADPVVGVRHKPVEKILVATAGWDEPVACVTLPVGRTWTFTAGDVDAVAQELTEAVVVLGQPFIDRWADWPALTREIGTLAHESTRHFLLPAVALAGGDRSRAQTLVRAEVARLAGRQDGYAVAYRDFARRLNRLAEGGT